MVSRMVATNVARRRVACSVRTCCAVSRTPSWHRRRRRSGWTPTAISGSIPMARSSVSRSMMAANVFRPGLPGDCRTQARSLKFVPVWGRRSASSSRRCRASSPRVRCSATWRSASSNACATIRSTELMPGTMMRRRRHSSSITRASLAPLVVVSAIGRSHSCNVVRSGRLSGMKPNASRSASSCSYRVGPRVA